MTERVLRAMYETMGMSFADIAKSIEAFGRYWHPPEDEVDRTDYYRARGYRTLVLWEDESDESMMDKIGMFTSQTECGR